MVSMPRAIFFCGLAAALVFPVSLLQAAVPAAEPEKGVKPARLYATGAVLNLPGRAVYEMHCVACHRVDGSGGRIGPQLAGKDAVSKNPERLIEVILKGSAAWTDPARRKKFSVAMTAFPQLTDRELADLVNYLRADFGDGAEPLSDDTVAQARQAVTSPAAAAKR